MSGDAYGYDEPAPGYFVACDPKTGVYHNPAFTDVSYRQFWPVLQELFDITLHGRRRDLETLTHILTFDPAYRDKQFQIQKGYYLYLLWFANWGPLTRTWFSQGQPIEIANQTILTLILDSTSPAMHDYPDGIFFRIPVEQAIAFLESLPAAFDTHISGESLYETIRSVIENYRAAKTIETQLAQLTVNGESTDQGCFARPRP